MSNKHKYSQNYIIESFKKGEISIIDAFNKLREFETTGINTKYYIQKNFRIQNSKKEKFQSSSSEKNNPQNIMNYLDEMNSLVGLEKIKNLIKEYIAFIKVQKLRENYNLKSSPVVMHMIFKGNPGTGKTTMARIIGKIFKEIGFLKDGEVIEAERADLVGEYIGHTAQKTKKIIEKALDGVLFIDEAYSLARGGEKDFGKEAIDTMVKAMEDHKDNLIIILAGYRKEMDLFLKSNPGLASRFAIQMDFPDYTIDQLVKIAELMYGEREYILDKTSKHYIYRSLTNLKNKEIINGNARTVRNLVERSIRHHAKRIINNNNINKRNLMYITKEDLYWEEYLDDRLSCNRDA